MSRISYLWKSPIGLFFALWAILFVIFQSIWSDALFPVGDEINPYLWTLEFNLNRWFQEGLSRYYHSYPGWEADAHRVIRPMTHLSGWVMVQLAQIIPGTLTPYQLQLLVITYASIAALAAVVYAIACKIYHHEWMTALLPAIVLITSGPVMAWPVLGWSLNGFDVLCALLSTIALAMLATRKFVLAALLASIACLTKEGALPVFAIIGCLCLLVPRYRMGGLVLLGPMIWALIRVNAFGSLFSHAPTDGAGFEIHLRLILGLPFSYTRNLYPKEFAPNHLLTLFMFINASVWAALASRIIAHRKALRKFQFTYHNFFETPARALQSFSAILCLGLIPYLIIIESTLGYIPRYFTIALTMFLIWWLSLKQTKAMIAVMGLCLAANLYGAWFHNFHPLNNRFHQDEYQAGQNLIALLRKHARENPDRVIYLANDWALVGSKGEFIAELTGVKDVFRINEIMIRDQILHQTQTATNTVVQTEDQLTFTTQLPAPYRFHFSGIKKSRLAESWSDDKKSFIRGSMTYRFPRMRDRSSMDFGDLMQVTFPLAKAFRKDSVLIAWDFKTMRWEEFH